MVLKVTGIQIETCPSLDEAIVKYELKPAR